MAWLISKRMMDDYENSHSLPGLVGESLEDSCTAGEQSVQSSGTPTPQAYLWPDKTTAAWKPSPSGITWKLLADSLGEAVLTSYLEASHARTSPVAVKEPESLEPDRGFGRSSRESFARWDPATSSWRTAHYSLDEELMLFSGTWPRWGCLHNGECWEQSMPEHLTVEKESGLPRWLFPTPVVAQAPNKGANTKGPKTLDEIAPTQWSPGMQWPTPTRNDYLGSGYQRAGGKPYFTLPGAVGSTSHLPPELREKLKQRKEWRTPMACDWKNRGCSSQLHLTDQVRPDQVTNEKKKELMKREEWPTPTACMTTGPGSQGREGGLNLQTAIHQKSWPTPLATDGSHGGPNQRGSKGDLRLSSAVHHPEVFQTFAPGTHGRGGSPHRGVVDALIAGEQPRVQTLTVDEIFARECQAQGISSLDEYKEKNVSSKLNPDWVELLMGWPLGWTRLTPMNEADLLAWFEVQGVYWLDPEWEVVPRVTTEVLNRANRLKCLGNGQVSACAAMAWQHLSQNSD